MIQRSLTDVETDPPFGVPRRPRPRNLTLIPPPAPQAQAVDFDQHGAPVDDHQDISQRALANLAAEIGSVALANAENPPPSDGNQILGALECHQRAIDEIDIEVAREIEEGQKLRATAARLKAAYESAMAPLIEALNAQTRREANLRRDYERRVVRMQTKRPSRKRA